MTIREVLHHPDPRLRTVAEPVTEFDDSLKVLVDDMFETMYAEKGAGLAATQINVHKRVVVVDMSTDRSEQRVWINPEVIEKTGVARSEEGCLSVPGVWAEVERAKEVTFRYQDLTGASHTLTVGEGDRLTVAIQHEGDHLDGKLYIDLLSPLKRNRLVKKMKKHLKQQES